MDELREEERLKEAAKEVNPIYASVGSAFKRLLWAFESEVGMSPPSASSG